ncbi:MAG: hypothetical protein HYU37_17610 [Acidobacteria bacterium]|nr:hypothetical protein [Acidobacteriota bacterium]
MRIAVLAVLAVVMVTGHAAAAWQEYIYLDRNVAIQFPAPPQVRAATHQSTLLKGLPATIYSAEDDHVLYRLTVVDLAGHTDAATNLLNEAAYVLMREGDLLFTDFPRVYNDERAIYGLTLVVDRTDGSRARSSLYVSKGRLYIAEAIVQPARGDKDMTVPSRFDQTIRFPPDGRFD